MVLTGAVRTKERLWRWKAEGGKDADVPTCDYCGEEDTVQHRWWACPRWTSYRPQALPYDTNWAQCLLQRGILPLDPHYQHLIPWICTIQDMMHKIHIEYMEAMNIDQRQPDGRIPRTRLRTKTPTHLITWRRRMTVNPTPTLKDNTRLIRGYLSTVEQGQTALTTLGLMHREGTEHLRLAWYVSRGRWIRGLACDLCGNTVAENAKHRSKDNFVRLHLRCKQGGGWARSSDKAMALPDHIAAKPPSNGMPAQFFCTFCQGRTLANVAAFVKRHAACATQPRKALRVHSRYELAVADEMVGGGMANCSKKKRRRLLEACCVGPDQ